MLQDVFIHIPHFYFTIEEKAQRCKASLPKEQEKEVIKENGINTLITLQMFVFISLITM